MSEIFDIASQYARHLATRQGLIANNIANANTPGFTPQDAMPFSIDNIGSAKMENSVDRPQAETLHSGNGVDLDQELHAAWEVTRNYTLNNAITKAFHRIALATIKA